MGHSFGGSKALHLASQSKHISRAINLDGALFGKDLLHSLEKPCLIIKAEKSVHEMVSSSCAQKKDLSQKLGISLEDAQRFIDAYTGRLDALCQNLKVQTQIIKEATHMAFTDFSFLNQSPLFSEAYVESRKGLDLIVEIRAKVSSFLSL